jgi:hypothetical protein
MVTVFRAYGLHIVIFVDDPRPAHVHVFGDGQAKIDLLGAGGEPALVWSEGMRKTEVRRAMRTVTEQQALLLQQWERIHGRLD